MNTSFLFGVAVRLLIQELSDADIASVMNPERLNQLLTQADAFTRVNSEDLNDF